MEPREQHDFTNLFCEICKINIGSDQKKIHCIFCESIFHQDHLQIWTKSNSHCPNCREQFPFEFMLELRKFGNKMHNPALQRNSNRINDTSSSNSSQSGRVLYEERLENQTCYVCGEDGNPIFRRLSVYPKFNVCSFGHWASLNTVIFGLLMLVSVICLIFITSLPIIFVLLWIFFSISMIGKYHSAGWEYRDNRKTTLLLNNIWKNCQIDSSEENDRFYSLFANTNVCSFTHFLKLDPFGVIYMSSVISILILLIFSNPILIIIPLVFLLSLYFYSITISY